MEKIYTVGFSQEQVNYLGFKNLDLPILHENDTEYHNYITSIFANNDIDVIVFDLNKNLIQSLKLSLHIRLSLAELKEKTLIPIVFLTTQSLESIIKLSDIWYQIIATGSVYFTELKLVKHDVQHVEGLNESSYKNSFLNKIVIRPDESIGKHSIANEWGAFSLDKAANTEVLKSNENLKKTFHKLYFKYIQALQFDLETLNKKSHIKGYINVEKADLIESNGKKIVLIDDEAEKGWGLVLGKLFKNADFRVVNEKIKSFEDLSDASKKMILEEEIDLFLIDLRLNGVDEDDNLPIEKFSGYDVISKIKNQNKGNQIIVFTASNKVWNIKPLLDFGTEAFYVKESPEYLFSKEISQNNYQSFKKNVAFSFNRSYLKAIYSRIDNLISILNTKKTEQNENFIEEILVLLNQAIEMHDYAKTEKQFAYAYVTLYMIIEIINKEYAKEDEEKNWCIDGEKVKKWRKIDHTIDFDDTDEKYRSEANKILGIAIQKLEIDQTNEMLLTVNRCVTRRTIFIHPKATNKEGELMKADGKIYTKEGFTELFNLIELLLTKIN